ncbi:MAG: IS110 family transposase [Kiritimatiellia bacterium]|jgi:transposase
MNKKEAEETDGYAALIGLDWATEKHDVYLWDAATGEVQHRVVQHSPEALSEWLCELQTRYPGQRLALCLEQSRGALIYALMGYAFLDLYPVNPATLARYRAAFVPSRAKDDPSDARLLCEILRLHREKLTVWKPDDEQTRTLGFLNEERRKAVNLRVKLVLRMQAALKLYFPQALAWVGTDLSSPMACDWLLKWPTLEAVQRARPQTVRAFFYAHNCRSAARIESVLAALPTAKPLTTDAAVLAVQPLTVQMLAKQLRLLHHSIIEYERQIAALFRSHPDAPLFENLPGAGKAIAPRLLAAFGSDRSRHPTAQNMQTHAGIAPVVERSGKSCWTHWRWNCPKFLRQTFHEFAKSSIPYSVWAKAYYDQQKSRGKGHNAAIRSLAFKWVRIIHRCWLTRTPYDESLYLQALAQRGSPLCAFIAAPTQET